MIIEIKDLVFRRKNNLIFDGVNLRVKKGAVTAIMGPSGTGKTTLLNLITGQLKPDSGQIFVFGERVDTMTERQLTQLRKSMGFLFQSGALFTDLSVYDNVAFSLRENTNLDESLIRTVVLMKLEAVGLRGAMHLMPTELSGGMRRRVALARAIAMDPSLMFYDEPFAGQDPISMGMLVSMIQSLNKLLGLTSVIVSHDVIETASICDEICILSEGKVKAFDSPDALQQSESPWVSQFMHAKADGPVPFHYPAIPYEDALMMAKSAGKSTGESAGDSK
ncbi:ABC transporter ATP-binding protein [Ostreibacterium oceani]|uniref:ATP-binding cassette domain-containing protein n=1 Tax=Ostreibacterium oceani TaxID=2654998 RepID=A0A6N7EV90_9GAMM|nr:ABC transporter ATP-binding protein [Ostreibacterium oceani]MPV86684.1 ATP-binding cassette domain-containing protein [Ostreibacterium oceani]